MLARRWGLPKSIATAIERHHSDEIDDEAALVRLADMLAHYAQGGAIVARRHAPGRPRRSASAPTSCAR